MTGSRLNKAAQLLQVWVRDIVTPVDSNYASTIANLGAACNEAAGLVRWHPAAMRCFRC